MEERKLHADGQINEKAAFDKHFLQTFWSLADNSPSKRIEGAIHLLKFVVEKQADVPEPVAPENSRLCNEVQYALKRLVRGLASVRESARQGFAAALTELLLNIDAIEVQEVLRLIKLELLHPEEKKSKQYIKQYVVGQIFAYVSIIQSGKLSKVEGSYSVLVIEQLQSLAKWKSYLQDICYPAIIELVQKTSAESFAEHLWPHLETELKTGWEACTPYSFALLLACHHNFPNVVKKKFFLKHYGSKEIFNSNNHDQIKGLLYQSRHSVSLSILFDQIIANISERSTLVELWKVLTQGGNDVKLFTLSLLERILPSCSEEEVTFFFGDDLVRYLLSQLASKTSNNREHLLKFTEKLPIVLHLMKDPKAQLTLLQRVLVSPGHLKFDDITRTQTHRSMVKQLSLGGVKLYLDWLKIVFISGISPTNEVDTGPESDSDDNSMKRDILNIDRRWAAARMMVVVKQPMIPKTEEVVMSVARFFFVHAFFDTADADSEILEVSATMSKPLSDDVQNELKDMFKALVRIVSNAPPYQGDKNHENPISKQCGFTPEGELRVFLLTQYAQSLLNNSEVECREPFTEESNKAWDEMMSAVTKIRKKLSSHQSLMAGQAFQLLFLHVGLQLFTEPEQSIDILKDLQGCYQRAISKRRSSKKKNEEPEWTEVVVEILLSILSRPDLPLRMVIEIAFRMICPHLTEGALQLLLDVFDPKKSNIEVTDSDVEDEDDDEEQADDSDDDDDEEEEEEEEQTQKKNLKENGHVEHDKSESSDESDSEEEEEVVDSEFLKKVKDILGDAAMPVDDASDNEDDDAESDSDMSDDAMMKKDAALSEIFKQRRKKGSKAIKAQLVNFKLRVLELIDIFIKKQSNNPLVVRLVVPILLVATSTSNQKEEERLSEKATVLFKNNLCKIKKYSHDISDQLEFMHKSIEEMLQLARKAHSTEAVSLVSCGCSFLMRMLKGNEESHDPSPVKTRHQRKEEVDTTEPPPEKDTNRMGVLDVSRVTKLYAEALEDFMTNRTTCLQANLFTDLVNRQEVIAWHLAADFAKYMNCAVLPYRQIQACVMLRNLYRMPYQGQKEEWHETCSSIHDHFMQTLDGIVSKPESKRHTVIKEILLVLQSHAKYTKYSSKEKTDLSELSSRLVKLQGILDSGDSGIAAKSADMGLALKRAIEAVNNEGDGLKKQKHRKRKKGWKRKHKESEASV